MDQPRRIAPEKVYAKEFWTGNSRDGNIVDGDGYHYYEIQADGDILDAYECYETDEGIEVVSFLPEMTNVNWMRDLGFADFEVLDKISQREFERIRGLNFEAS